MDDTDFIVQLALLGKKEVSESFERKYINYIHLIIQLSPLTVIVLRRQVKRDDS